MSRRYHLSNGEPKPCHAQSEETCTLSSSSGGEAPHFEGDLQDARAWAEQENERQYREENDDPSIARGSRKSKDGTYDPNAQYEREQREQEDREVRERKEKAAEEQKQKEDLADFYAEPSMARGNRSSRDGSYNPWGKSPDLRKGSQTRWGKAQHVEKPAPGVTVVDTASHGGFYLSEQRNQMIPEPLRNKDGIYEEDAEASIVGYYHLDAFPHLQKDGDPEKDRETRESFKKSVKSSFPDEWESATGEEVTEEESWQRKRENEINRRRSIREANSDKFVATGAASSPGFGSKWAPEGYVVAEARKDDTGEVKSYLVPEGDAIKDKMWGENYVIDEDRHIDVTEISEAQSHIVREGADAKRASQVARYGDDVGIDTSGLPAATRDRAEKELSTQYRVPDRENGGLRITTMRDYIESEGVVGKSLYRKSTGTRGYGLDTEDGHIIPVKKSVYDAVQGAPDTTSESTRLSLQIDAVENRLDKQRENFPVTESEVAKLRKTEQDLAALRDKQGKLFDKECEEAREREDRSLATARKMWDDLKQERGLDI